ncbi:hypothetical protein A2316_00455 [Candidatus Falkowbacteria bacterium RIFOXYB2_FULL_38_15]|uniref:Antitoxin SocA-like Panacea domain-containing protein n=1 Tax=Candidatus Falkowbacteria bacterium RIFOXYA2_FULL_38_12 TaxID=1797993 RepID=A0A1F5S1M4_9BACT|nr:MAG: hypothetical protein A2257_04410 [Candidatus Falkowbacteria bacterium RIFOXYA2_FULL_38_12]OGF32868.1 MAG: hypothetical protein A2316_00455 [Candidatus Falkowbacteria bacterium RIFOXYB2_FULL_38_15]OGF44004.1 MAG: hypothetical protein A2555_01185 [Candidatus Falkowbacteria bacterium RIFOXYD2_FULL_39_16]
MTISLPKLKAIIKYLCHNTNPAFLGKTKLMKLFYFLDFTQIKRYGVSITGETYYHLEFGPIPTTIKNLVDSVSDDPETALLSDTIQVHCCGRHDIHKIVCLQSFTENDKEYFSQVELDTMEEVTKRFGGYSTKQIVDVSHKEAPWKLTKELEVIPYQLAAEDPDCIVDRDDIDLLSKI